MCVLSTLCYQACDYEIMPIRFPVASIIAVLCLPCAIKLCHTLQNLVHLGGHTHPGVLPCCVVSLQMLGLLWVYTWVGSISFVLFYSLHFFNVLRVKRHEEEVRVPHAVGGEGGVGGGGTPSLPTQAGLDIPFQWQLGHGVAADPRDMINL